MFKKIFSSFAALVSAFAFQSKLQPHSSDAGIIHGQYNPFPNGRFRAPFETNGASRRRKTNRLRLSKNTRNKHR